MDTVLPMLASAVSDLPVGPGWAYEFKWDGVRALVDVREGRVRITSRAGNDATAAYPELARLVADAEDALVDGEIVAIGADGRPSFELLQTRMHVRSAGEADKLAASTPVTFVAFDLLRRYGVDLTARPYAERRATLVRWLGDQPGWTVSPSFDDGPATVAAAREHGLEGVVAKRLDSPYRAGLRSPDWRKLRFVHTGDFAVIGWEGAANRPTVPSSLVLAEQRDGALHFCGKVGSGLDTRTVRALSARFQPLPECPVNDDVPRSPGGRVVTWVAPEVIVEVRFTERTDDGRLRHPVFIRVRDDKREATGDA